MEIADVLQAGRLLFLIYINDLRQGFRLFADDTSLFLVANSTIVSVSDQNNDLVKIQDWWYKWKVSFNFDPANQHQECSVVSANGRFFLTSIKIYL